MEKTSGAVLLVIGAVALFAAIVGGGVKIREIEVGSLPSKWRQWLLGLFGLVVGAIGLIMVLPDDDSTKKSADIQNVAADADSNDSNEAGADASVNVDASASDANADENSASTDENAAQ